MENDRTVRRLTALMRSGSTARVLNLNATRRKYGDDPSLSQHPFFQNRFLDRCILLKHRLREHEYFLFATSKPNATKLLIPLDGNDLKLGARFAFVGQRDFDQLAEEVFGSDLAPGAPDRRTLELIDELPSLDPFLLREHLKRHGVTPSRFYFNVSDADLHRMRDFVRHQVTALVTLSSKDNAGAFAHASRLVDKLLSHSPEEGFEPLKKTLRLDDKDYLDGVFAWRGFLYYKWVLSDLTQPAKEIVRELAEVSPRGRRDPEASAYLPGARRRLQAAIVKSLAEMRESLEIYDRAYAALTRDGKPAAFRDFLLAAPDMFTNLGAQVGALQHIVSFWRYRFPPGRPKLVEPVELMDVLLDFEDSLAVAPEEADGEAA